MKTGFWGWRVFSIIMASEYLCWEAAWTWAESSLALRPTFGSSFWKSLQCKIQIPFSRQCERKGVKFGNFDFFEALFWVDLDSRSKENYVGVNGEGRSLCVPGGGERAHAASLLPLLRQRRVRHRPLTHNLTDFWSDTRSLALHCIVISNFYISFLSKGALLRLVGLGSLWLHQTLGSVLASRSWLGTNPSSTSWTRKLFSAVRDAGVMFWPLRVSLKPVSRYIRHSTRAASFHHRFLLLYQNSSCNNV
jgi:hypothetical protein